MRTSGIATFVSLVLAVPSFGALYDSLDTLDHFGTPLNSSLQIDSPDPGVVSFISNQESVDRLVDWMFNGMNRLGIGSEGLVTVTPTIQLGNGEWSLWALHFDSSGGFLEETILSPFTSSASPVQLDVADTAPTGSAEFFLRIRIREGVGDGFAFTSISAVPEASTSLIAMTLGLLPVFSRNRRAR